MGVTVQCNSYCPCSKLQFPFVTSGGKQLVEQCTHQSVEVSCIPFRLPVEVDICGVILMPIRIVLKEKKYTLQSKQIHSKSEVQVQYNLEAIIYLILNSQDHKHFMISNITAQSLEADSDLDLLMPETVYYTLQEIAWFGTSEDGA